MDSNSVPTGLQRSCNDRMKERWPAKLWSAIIAATVIHLLAFLLWPTMSVPSDPDSTRQAVAADPVEVLRVREALPRAPIGLSTPMPSIPVAPLVPMLPLALVDLPDVQAMSAPGLPRPSRGWAPLERARPAFLPAFVPALLVNGRDVARQLRPAYERLLYRWNAAGRAIFELHVEADGRVSEHELVTSSGDERLDRLAERAIVLMRFTPELRYGEPRASWVRMPVSFMTLAGA